MAAPAVGIAYCAACCFIIIQQPKFIFFPSSVVDTTPAKLNLPYEEVWLSVPVTATKVERIHGWWIENQQSPKTKVLLYFHGNGLNISANLSAARGFNQAGFSVLLIDYRGYGLSEGGFPNEQRIYQDAATAWNYLIGERQVKPRNIFIYGHSLGGGVAIDLAAKNPEAAGLIVEATFSSIRDIVKYRKQFWMFPVDLMVTQRFESIAKVPKLKMPVLFIHGVNDSTIPASMTEKLYAATPEPKLLLLVPGADHNDIGAFAPQKYRQAVESFLKLVDGDSK
ncbi:alpha/beta hydrolase [Calothrix sp. PCC 6303]|uniref:alpha/beta hydrolase n=1 Tax=Calothrix sp. PCC 6303 TaxID=1170562 RepID=UPI0002A03FF4|nr:alpha/beta hydrolase [Calothrix sp. PCC 6303]AFZ00306.1 alpha/beta hydrolase fold protein [Calothrix sp. PCC 6303]